MSNLMHFLNKMTHFFLKTEALRSVISVDGIVPEIQNASSGIKSNNVYVLLKIAIVFYNNNLIK